MRYSQFVNTAFSLLSNPICRLPLGQTTAAAARDWRIEASWNWQTPITLVLVAGLLGLFCFLAVRTLRGQNRIVAGSLFLNRCFCLSLMAIILLQARVKTTTFDRPVLKVLLDTSASMEQVESSAMAGRLPIGTYQPHGGISRFDLARAALDSAESRLLRDLQDRFDVQLQTFDVQLNPPLDKPSTDQSMLDTVDPDGAATHLFAALEAVYRSIPESSLTAVVLITDGNSTDGSDVEWTQLANRFRRRRVPIFSCGVGEPTADLEIDLVRLEYEPVGFAGEPHEVHVVLDVAGDPDRSLHVVLKGPGDQKELNSVRVPLDRSTSRSQVTIQIPQLQPGSNQLEIEITPNTSSSVGVTLARQLRVWGRSEGIRSVLIDHTARWELQHLRRLLQQDEKTLLETSLFETDQKRDHELPELANELHLYDVVVIGDVDFREFPETFPRLLRDAVSQNGVGLMLLSGPQSIATCSVSSTWSDLHPATVHHQLDRQPTRRKLKLIRPSNIASFLPDEWVQDGVSRLPPSFSTIEQVHLAPAAEAFMSMQAGHSELAELPVLIRQRIGHGQVVQLLIDDTWRWKAVDSAAWYRLFWKQSIRSLSRQRMVQSLPPFELSSDQRDYTDQDLVRLQFLDRRSQLSSISRVLVQVETDTDVAQVVALERVPQTVGLFAGSLSGLAAGRYTATALTKTAQENMSEIAVHAEWTVSQFDHERAAFPMNATLLQQLASQSGGQFSDIHNLKQLTKSLPVRSATLRSETVDIPLWNRHELFLLLMVSLAIEWGLRRRAGID